MVGSHLADGRDGAGIGGDVMKLTLEAADIMAIHPAPLARCMTSLGAQKTEPYDYFSDVWMINGFELIIPRCKEISDYVYVVARVIDVLSDKKIISGFCLFYGADFYSRRYGW